MKPIKTAKEFNELFRSAELETSPVRNFQITATLLIIGVSTIHSGVYGHSNKICKRAHPVEDFGLLEDIIQRNRLLERDLAASYRETLVRENLYNIPYDELSTSDNDLSTRILALLRANVVDGPTERNSGGNDMGGSTTSSFLSRFLEKIRSEPSLCSPSNLAETAESQALNESSTAAESHSVAGALSLVQADCRQLENIIRTLHKRAVCFETNNNSPSSPNVTDSENPKTPNDPCPLCSPRSRRPNDPCPLCSPRSGKATPATP